MTSATEAFATSSVQVALLLQLVLLHRAGLRRLDALEQSVPDSMVEDIRPEAPPIEIHIALDCFRRGVWAKHGRHAMLHFMENCVRSSAQGPPRVDSATGHQALCPGASSSAPPPPGLPPRPDITPQEQLP